jgi:hypothetical protein
LCLQAKGKDAPTACGQVMYSLAFLRILMHVRTPTPQNRDYTEARLLGFSYDFGVIVICHQNADAMVLASALMRGIHPPDNSELKQVTFLTTRTSTGSKVDVFHQSQPLTQSSDVTHAVRVVKNVTCLSSLIFKMADVQGGNASHKRTG